MDTIQEKYNAAIQAYKMKTSAPIIARPVVQLMPRINDLSAGSEGLSNDYFMDRVPSVLSEGHSRTAKYTQVPTLHIINAMRDNGFVPVTAGQRRTIDPARRDFARHIIKFRALSNMVMGAQDVVPEIVLLNSHDGSSAYKMLLGIFRLVCANGLIVSESIAASITVRHTGGHNTIDRILSAARTIAQSGADSFNSINTWRGIELSSEARTRYAQGAFDLYRGNKDIKVYIPSLIAPIRRADTGNSLWSVFNVVQEKLIRGGFHAQNGRGYYRRARAINSIDRDVTLNQKLWAYTAEFGQNLN